MFLDVFLFLVGFIFLIVGAHGLIRGASSIAKRAGLSDLFIGLTIVAFGTTMTELSANIVATLKGNFGITFGNVIGSNISNLLLVLGVAALVSPIIIKESTVKKEIPYNLLAIFVFFVLANDALAGVATESFLSRIDGLLLLIFFGIFVFYNFISSKVEGINNKIKFEAYPYPISISLAVGGVVMLTLGGQWVVNGAVGIAEILGVSQVLIGLTIVALGTSLPELVTVTVAAYKKSYDIALGNVIGANIFNILWVLGISSLIRRLSFPTFLNYDLLFFVGAMILFLVFMFSGKKNVLERWEGALMIILYIIYIIYLVIRG